MMSSRQGWNIIDMIIQCVETFLGTFCVSVKRRRFLFLYVRHRNGAALNESISSFSHFSLSEHDSKGRRNEMRTIDDTSRLMSRVTLSMLASCREWERHLVYCRPSATCCNGHQQQRAIKTDGVSLRFTVASLSLSLANVCACLCKWSRQQQANEKTLPPPPTMATCRQSFFFYYDARAKTEREYHLSHYYYQEIKRKKREKEEMNKNYSSSFCLSFFHQADARVPLLFCRRFVARQSSFHWTTYGGWPAECRLWSAVVYFWDEKPKQKKEEEERSEAGWTA